jgi:hypothetical protein
MDEGQDPHRLVVDLVDQSVMRVGDQLAGAGDFTGTAQLWMLCQLVESRNSLSMRAADRLEFAEVA